MKNLLKAKLTLILYIIYWWLTLTVWSSPDLFKDVKFTLDNIWYIFKIIIILLPFTFYPILRYVNFLVDYMLGFPIKTSKEAEERYFESDYVAHILEGAFMSALIWTPTFITYKFSSPPPLDWFTAGIAFSKFFIVAFLFYCIDELLVEAIKKRLPKENN